jgi:hypothetical protein
MYAQSHSANHCGIIRDKFTSNKAGVTRELIIDQGSFGALIAELTMKRMWLKLSPVRV